MSGYCLSAILGSYKRLALRGQLLTTPEARVERDALLLAWAMSNDVHEIALHAIGMHAGIQNRQTEVATVHFGQISGSIDARETLLQQHLTTDPSLFVVNDLIPSKESQMRNQVVAWVLKRARDEISKSLQSNHSYDRQVLEARLAVQISALTVPALRQATSANPRRFQPGETAIKLARRSKTGLHPKSANALRIHEGLRRFSPFAVRRILLDTLIDRLGDQRLLELAGGLALAEALSIASGHPLVWNSSIAQNGVIAKVGPFAVGWHYPVNFDAGDSQSIISATDISTGSCVSILRCADASGAAFENDSILLATESLVAACRKEAKKGPRFEETPLADCAVLMRRLFNYHPEAPTPNRLTITEFGELSHGRLLELAFRAYRRSNLK